MNIGNIRINKNVRLTKPQFLRAKEMLGAATDCVRYNTSQMLKKNNRGKTISAAVIAHSILEEINREGFGGQQVYILLNSKADKKA